MKIFLHLPILVFSLSFFSLKSLQTSSQTLAQAAVFCFRSWYSSHSVFHIQGLCFTKWISISVSNSESIVITCDVRSSNGSPTHTVESCREAVACTLRRSNGRGRGAPGPGGRHGSRSLSNCQVNRTALTHTLTAQTEQRAAVLCACAFCIAWTLPQCAVPRH